MRNKPRKYQTGGDDSTAFFNQVANMYSQQLDQQSGDMPDATEEPAAPEADPYAGYDSDYEDLSQKYSDLQDQFTQLSSQFENQNFGQNDFGNDQFLNFLFKDDDNNMPMDFGSPGEAAGSMSPRPQGTVNPYVKETERDILSSFPAKSMGIWGDQAHQARKSDHNTGDAEDFGFDTPQTGQAIAAKLQAEAKQRGVKYVIYNHRIWNPDVSNDWRPYNGPNPHTDHVHVSYKRQTGGYAATPEEQHTGLNNSDYWSMFFPMQGQNMFRGLDSGQPVHLQDETGKQTILYGPDHTAQMNGAVHEQRMQTGGKVQPYYTTNPRDPRIQQYKDSLTAYNSGISKAQAYKDYPVTQAHIPIQPNEQYIDNSSINRNIKPIDAYRNSLGSTIPVYKKPVQPVVVQQNIGLTPPKGWVDPRPQQPNGVKPIFTDNPNDPRLRAYKDSLNNYNKYLSDAKSLNLPTDKVYSSSEYTKIFDGRADPIKADYWGKEEKPIGHYISANGIMAQYAFKKPVQPVIYKPDPAPVHPTISGVQNPMDVPPHYQLPLAQPRADVAIPNQQTQYSYSYRTDDGQQQTHYFPDWDTWHSFVQTQPIIDAPTNVAKTYGHATGHYLRTN